MSGLDLWKFLPKLVKFKESGHMARPNDGTKNCPKVGGGVTVIWPLGAAELKPQVVKPYSSVEAVCFLNSF